jgi:hypothetical protein
MTENALYTHQDDGDTGRPKKQTRDEVSLEKVKEETQLTRLRSVVQQKVERPIVLIPVPERHGVSLRVSPNITQSQMKNWRKNAGEDSRSGLDATKFACLVIGHTTIGFCMDDEEIFDENSFNLTFAHPAILEMTDVTRPVPDGVRALFGVDPHIESAALAILDAAGYSDTVSAVDPTKESSTN